MAKLSRDEIRRLTQQVGLPEIFVDIAMAESSGDPNVVNEIGCVGLWQINQPVHVKAHPTWTKTWLKNPLNNAKAAKVLYDADGTRPWVSSQSKWGDSSLLDKAKTVWGYTPPGYVAGRLGDTASAIPNAIGGAANAFTQTFMKVGLNLVAVQVAIVLLVLGVVILFRSALKSVPVPGVGQVAKSVAKVGK